MSVVRQSVAHGCVFAIMVVTTMILGICVVMQTSVQAEVWMVRHSVETPSGRISYLEQGKGPVALFVHGVLLNGYLRRHQLADLSDVRRCRWGSSRLPGPAHNVSSGS